MARPGESRGGWCVGVRPGLVEVVKVTVTGPLEFWSTLAWSLIRVSPLAEVVQTEKEQEKASARELELEFCWLMYL